MGIAGRSLAGRSSFSVVRSSHDSNNKERRTENANFLVGGAYYASKETVMLRRRIVLVIAFLAASTIYAATGAPVHRTINVAPGGTLTIEADVGNIQVTAGNGNSVTVDVTQSSRANRYMDITVDQQGNDVNVRGKLESRWLNWSDADAKFVVSVPSRYNVQLSTAGGDIRVSDLHGQAHVKTSGGSIKLGHIDGPVSANTSGGA